VTTAELAGIYGYNHPPRAAQDVRDLGFVLVTRRVRGPNGRSIAAYELVEEGGRRSGGRRAIPVAFKQALAARECTMTLLFASLYR